MNLRQIEVVTAILQAGSVSGAAALLGISQPSATRHLRNVESELGYLLFTREGGRVKPTPELRALRPLLRDATETLDKVAQRAISMAGSAPRLPRADARTITRAGIGAILRLLMPGLLMAGILFGVATPTEIAALAVVYGILLSALIYREMTLQSFMRIVIDTAALTGVLLFIFAAASSFSWTLTVALLPQRLVALLQSVGDSSMIFMVCSIVLLILVGVLLEGLPSLNVLAPLLLPIAGKLGLSELHYALVLIIAMGIGGFMPFAGVGFYVCCAVMRCNIETASRAMLPYLVVLIGGLLIVAFFPWLTLFLPHYFGFRG